MWCTGNSMHIDLLPWVGAEVTLDRCWDLLRQRRALREYGRDASEAQERDADTVKKYTG